MLLQDKVTLITGSAKGLGKHIALALVKQGATVVINYRKSKKEAEKVLKEVKKFNEKSMIIRCDVTNEKEVKRMFDKIFSKFGKVDILVNNVGNFVYKTISDTNENEWRDVIESNLYSTFYCTKHALPIMRKNKFGRIINIGCAGSEKLTTRKYTTPYYIAKTGVLMLTKAFAANEAKFGINVNMVSPGILENSQVKLGIPKGRLAKFEDVVNAVLFLLSKESDYITGANIK